MAKNTPISSNNIASKAVLMKVRKTPSNTTPKNTASKKGSNTVENRLLPIKGRCLWKLNSDTFSPSNPISSKVHIVTLVLKDFIKDLHETYPMLASKAINIEVSDNNNELVIDFMFIKEKYFTITIWKNNENKFFANEKYENFSQGSGKLIPLPEFYLSLYSRCETILIDIVDAINK